MNLSKADVDSLMSGLINALTVGKGLAELDELMRRHEDLIDAEIELEDIITALVAAQEATTGTNNDTLQELADLSRRIKFRFLISDGLLKRYKKECDELIKTSRNAVAQMQSGTNVVFGA
jgi:hypothetical protein